MPKALAVVVGLVLLLALLGGGTGQTDPFDQPPPGVTINVSTDTAHKVITVTVLGDVGGLWQWSNERYCADLPPTKSNPDCGCPRGHVNTATIFTYSGYISFWTHKPGDDFSDQPGTGQPVLHRVAWSANDCLPALWQVIVYAPGE